MSYSERAYFEGEPVAHCGAWEESRRLAAIAKRNRDAFRAAERRTGSRSRLAA
jgi:hypothetical protein